MTRKTGGRAKWVGDVFRDFTALEAPKSWKKPRKIFVNSLSDLFHERVPDAFIRDVFAVVHATPWHTFQVLTKRADRLLELSPSISWPSNLWMGLSIETEDYLWRADRLRRTEALTKFLSLKPLLGPLPQLDLNGIDWVIVGGESGPGARAMNPEWVRWIRDHANSAKVPFHFKQWGGTRKKVTGRSLDGRFWDEYPTS